MENNQPDRLLRLPEVLSKTGLSRTGLYDRLNARSRRHDATFPRPTQLGQRAVAFSERELDAWIAARMAARTKVAA